METVKELKTLLLKQLSEEELEKQYEQLKKENQMFARNVRMAYYFIAKQNDISLQTNIATTSREAFPLKIEEMLESEKPNFNLSGYLVSGTRRFVTQKGNGMIIFNIADDTGAIAITVFEDNLEKVEDLELEIGDYVTISNLFWADKNNYNPTLGDYSGIKKAKPPFGLSEIRANSIATMGDEGYYVIKGLVVDIPEEGSFEAYHCDRGHWFQGLKPSQVGYDIMCDKCDTLMEVKKHFSVQGVVFGDETDTTLLNISTFAELESLSVFDEYIFQGQFVDGSFNVRSALPLKKN